MDFITSPKGFLGQKSTFNVQLSLSRRDLIARGTKILTEQQNWSLVPKL